MSTPDRIDWRTVLMMPPQRRFTPEELARAIPEPPSRTLVWSVLINVALPVGMLLVVFGSEAGLPYAALLLASSAALLAAGWAVWRNPTGTVGRWAPWLLPPALGLGFGLLARSGMVERAALAALLSLLVVAAVVLWLAVIHRHQYVLMRLAELAERERAVEMARRLAAAQLEPHFLFNTLASLQHWVQTKDERAATLLEALTGYLRATLPMFARPTQPLAAELEAVRHYLQVMQARLGARLAFEIDTDPALATLPLPPGLLLTLAENAVEHGIEPRLAGGRVRIAAKLQADPSGAARAVIDVHDDGPGPPPDLADGIGLANCRERLALTHGTAAALHIAADPAGGCRATLTLPWRPEP